MSVPSRGARWAEAAGRARPVQLQRCVFEQHVRLPPLQGECAIDLVTEEAVLEEVSLELPIKLDTRTQS